MEQHAVPQDITGFKFKLVGDMTLKQFGELAGGAAVAYIFYATNWPGVIKWPFVLFFTLFGFALAFLPIEERPLDIWIGNFVKAIYKPTLYIWKKGAIRQPIPITAINVTTLADNPLVAAASTKTDEVAAEPWPFKPEPVETKEVPPPTVLNVTTTNPPPSPTTTLPDLP
ncbi:PrgI family protein, partial [Candidatus Microgenomates bacterium]|nr:PrgI family protein [Candidatus Microgenomates bacterium]